MVDTLFPGIRRITAPNASPMTFTGTNTYLLGVDEVAVVDPGPENESHLQQILTSMTPRQTITKILVTHSHLDHSPLARALSDKTDAPIYAYANSFDARSPVMSELAKNAQIGGGEGVDHDFEPDVNLLDGEVIIHDGHPLTAIWTPGHFSNHMCFTYRDALLSGDHVMGWASSLVSPPDGDLGAFMCSCRRLLETKVNRFLPGHGDLILDGHARVRWLIAHRTEREHQVLANLVGVPKTTGQLTADIYDNVDPVLIPAATRNVLAHLLDLMERKIVSTDDAIDLTSKFYLL